jgi:hypothetical protein
MVIIVSHKFQNKITYNLKLLISRSRHLRLRLESLYPKNVLPDLIQYHTEALDLDEKTISLLLINPTINDSPFTRVFKKFVCENHFYI